MEIHGFHTHTIFHTWIHGFPYYVWQSGENTQQEYGAFRLNSWTAKKHDGKQPEFLVLRSLSNKHGAASGCKKMVIETEDDRDFSKNSTVGNWPMCTSKETHNPSKPEAGWFQTIQVGRWFQSFKLGIWQYIMVGISTPNERFWPAKLWFRDISESMCHPGRQNSGMVMSD